MSTFRNFVCYENTSIFTRQDELILKMLWEAITSYSYNRVKLTDEHLRALDEETGRLYTQDGNVYWQYYDGKESKLISEDHEIKNAVDAFNALRGKQEFIHR